MDGSGRDTMAVEEKQVVSRPAAATYGLEYHNDDSSSSRVEKILNNKLMSDVTFIVGVEKQKIYAHKVHLATVSEYFYTLFYGNFAEAKRDEIELKDEDPETFLTILRLIYGAKVDINFENLSDVYGRIRMYLLSNEYCKPLIDFLMDQIVDKDTAMKIFRENQYYQFQRVNEACLSYIQTDPFYFFRKDDFTTLEQERLRKIVGLQQINCTEEQLLCALEKWEAANPELDTKDLRKLLKGTKRSYFSHKLIFRVDTKVVPGKMEDWSDGTFTITCKSRNPVSVYGFGVYLPPVEGDFSVKLYIIEDNRVLREISILNFIKRSTPNLEVADLMFEEIVFVTNKPYKFRLRTQNRESNFLIRTRETAKSTHQKISFIFDGYKGEDIPHMWVKFPECGVGKNPIPQKCCQIIKKKNKHYD